MAKQFKKGIMTLAQASEELRNLTVKLYRSKSFTRSGKVLSDQLFQTAVDAGAYLAAIGDLSDRTIKINTANEAVIKLDKTLYILKTMCEVDLYSSSQIAPLSDFIVEVITALKELLSKAPSTKRKINIMPPAGQKPEEKPALYNNTPAKAVYIPEESGAKQEESLPEETSSDDDRYNWDGVFDGFDEPAEQPTDADGFDEEVI